jgi:drug/metabolite transporter (DMT)-like permease
MIYLLITVATMTAWNFIFRGAQRREADMYVVGSVNYVCAAVACFAVARAVGGASPSAQTVQLAVWQGVIYVVSFFFLIPSMSAKGIAIVMAFTRLAVVVPVLASIILWAEIPHALQTIGIIGAVASLPMLSLDRGVGDGRFSSRQLWVFAGLFATNGIALILSKCFARLGVPGETLYYLAILFAVAAVGSLVPLIWQRRPVGLPELTWGAALGLANAACNLALLVALDRLPGIVVFPVNSCGGIVLAAIIAAVLWREIPGRLGFAGIGAAAAALVCLNIK